MIRKIFAVMLCLTLLLPGFRVSALEKSIEELSEETGITNSESSFTIPYNESEARVYYGETGINLFTPEGNVYFPTNYGVLKLISVGDVDGDGYHDFLSYQSVPAQVAQLLCLSGSDGHVISTVRLTRLGYDDNLTTNIDVNCFIQQMYSRQDGTAYVVYDYNVIKLNMADGMELGRFSETDNIWKIISIDDFNGDGTDDLAYCGQQNVAGIIDGNTMELLKQYHPAEEHTFRIPWDDKRELTAIYNAWDLYYESGMLYVLSENGTLNIIDIYNSFVDEKGNETANIVPVPLEVIDQETLDSLSANNLNWSYSAPVYRVTGINDWAYMGYRFADVNDQYMLINAYMGGLDSCSSWTDVSYPAKIAVYNRETGTVDTRFAADINGFKYQKTCLGVLNDQPVIAVINHTEEGQGGMALYDMEGKMIRRKDIMSSYFGYDRKMELSWDGEKYCLEIFNNGCLNVSADLKKIEPAYRSSETDILTIENDYILCTLSKSGVKKKISKYELDGKTLLWEYDPEKPFIHKGFEYIRYDRDYNRDGVKDVMILMSGYNNKDRKVWADFIIVNGKDGKAFMDKRVITNTYYDENWNKITEYLNANSFDIFRDVDGDGVYELNVEGTIVGSRKNEIIGNTYGGVEFDGMLLDVGDTNGDGLTDYVGINKKETRLFQSKLTYSYGYMEVEYRKTGTAFANPDKADAMNTSQVFGDINKDGVREIGMVDFNAEGRQVFKIINGRNLSTMYLLCPEGVKGMGEAFKVSNYDYNNDGFYELYGIEDWFIGMYNGKTGELLFRPEDSGYKEEYFADYIVPFTVMEYDDLTAVQVGDLNGDECPDVAYYKSYPNENWEQVFAMITLSGADFQQIGETIIGINDFENNYGNLVQIRNGGNLVALVNNEKKMTRIFDLEKNQEIAGYSLAATQMSAGKDGNLLALANKTLYSLNTEPSFVIKSEVPAVTDNYIVHLEWESLQDYSVMTVYDNTKIVYQGDASSCDIKLLAGKHNLKLSMDDGQGKTYSESVETEVTAQTKDYTMVGVVAGVTFLLSIIFGKLQKILINRKFRRKEAKKK